ncbi:putative F-box protein AUF1 [Helianthus annuus]|nr:putative F-box protein AUF1 [Helianthus annuus]
MDRLPESLLLQILSRLDDSADVARCLVASKAFDAVFPDLRSINLRRSKNWYKVCGKHLKKAFVDFISRLRIVESVCIRLDENDEEDADFDPTDGYFVKEWLPRVSESLQSLSLSVNSTPSMLDVHRMFCSSFLRLDQHLNELNKCLPNLQVLKLVGSTELKDPKIHLLNLQTCHWSVYNHHTSLTLITPNLITLTIECIYPPALRVEAPMLSHFHLCIADLSRPRAFTAKKFEHLKTLWLNSLYLCILLSDFLTTETIEYLTLGSRHRAPRNSKLTLGKVFMVFPNLTSLCLKPSAWSELEACLNPEGWEILDGRKGLKTISAYLMLDDPSLTFSSVSRVLDQCVGLSEVSLFIHADVIATESKSFMSKCMARWPGLKWRWGIWSEDMKDSWYV